MKREHAYKLRDMMHKAALSLPDEDALEAVDLFPAWAADTEFAKDIRVRYNGKLYRVRQTHTAQAQYPPSIDTAALYTEVEKPGQGDTPSNPIPYNNNMELYEGKYYLQDGVTYICFRSTGTPVYNPLSALVNIYVRVYEEAAL